MLSKRPLLVRGLLVLSVASLASISACSSDSSPGPEASGGEPGSGGANDVGGSSHLPQGAAEHSGEGGGPADPVPGADAGAAGASSGGGAPGVSADALPTSTFLYVYSETKDSDWLIARDFRTGEERVVTDLRGDDSDGWEIWGHTISPDRRRIAIASLYGATQADVDTMLATRRIWTFDTDGSDFQRLTPVFPNTGAGRTNFNIAVQDPTFTADGSAILYDYGEWYYEGTTLRGISLPWYVSTNGGLPELFETISGCTVVDPSVNPATGEVLVVHSVCIDSDDEGIFLYPSAGGTEPTKLVDRGYGPGTVDPSLDRASWLGDGTGFAFVGTIEVTRETGTDIARSLLAYDTTTGDVTSLVIPEPDTSVQSVAVSADGTSLVYCLYHDDAYDLHAIDLTLDEPIDVPITNDGKSCHPGF